MKRWMHGLQQLDVVQNNDRLSDNASAECVLLNETAPNGGAYDIWFLRKGITVSRSRRSDVYAHGRETKKGDRQTDRQTDRRRLWRWANKKCR
jgi:hypothetical protein